MRLVCVLAIAALSIAQVVAQDVESSRIYGKMFVSPIEVGAFPPVCVTEYVVGPNVKQGFKVMRDPERPSIVVFCKDYDPSAAKGCDPRSAP